MESQARTPWRGHRVRISEAEDAFDFEIEDDDADLEIEDGEEMIPSSTACFWAPQVDLSVDQQMAIDAFKGIDEKSFHEIPLPQSADQRAIKKRTTGSARYHPDKFYRKNLRGFKLKLEVIFNKITGRASSRSDAGTTTTSSSARGARGEGVDRLRGVTTVSFVPRQRSARRNRRPARPPEAREEIARGLRAELPETACPVMTRAAMKKGQQAMEVEDWDGGQSVSNAMTLDLEPPCEDALQARRGATPEREGGRVLPTGPGRPPRGGHDQAAELLQQAVDCKPTKGKYYFEFGKLILEHTLQQKVALEMLRKAWSTSLEASITTSGWGGCAGTRNGHTRSERRARVAVGQEELEASRP